MRKNSQAAQKGPDARRRLRAAREAYSLYVERAAEGAVPPQMGLFQQPASVLSQKLVDKAAGGAGGPSTEDAESPPAPGTRKEPRERGFRLRQRAEATVPRRGPCAARDPGGGRGDQLQRAGVGRAGPLARLRPRVRPALPLRRCAALGSLRALGASAPVPRRSSGGGNSGTGRHLGGGPRDLPAAAGSAGPAGPRARRRAPDRRALRLPGAPASGTAWPRIEGNHIVQFLTSRVLSTGCSVVQIVLSASA